MTKNKIRTPSYFTKRLRDNGYVVIRIFSVYGKHDPRRWTVLVNPSESSVYITCYFNRTDINEVLFEFNDGGLKIPRNFSMKTDSIESIVQFLNEHDIQGNINYPGRDRYLVKNINIDDEPKEVSQEGQGGFKQIQAQLK